MCSLSKEQSMLSRETIQNTFFPELCPFLSLTFYPYQAPHSRELAPAFGALVNPLLYIANFQRPCERSCSPCRRKYCWKLRK